MVFIVRCNRYFSKSDSKNFRTFDKFIIFDSLIWTVTALKMKFSIKDFFSKCDQIRRKLQISLHLLKKSFMENFIFCVVFTGPHLEFFWVIPLFETVVDLF